MRKKRSQENTQGAVPNNPARPALQLDANLADVRAAWRAAFQEKAKPRPSLWPLLWGLLGGLAATLLIGAVVLFVPPVRDAVAGRLARQPALAATPTQPTLSGAQTLAFEGMQEYTLLADGTASLTLTLVVTGTDGRPATDIPIKFSVEPQGEQIKLPTLPPQQTDGNGRAQITVTAGKATGTVSLIAQAAQKTARVSIRVVLPPTAMPTETPAVMPTEAPPTAMSTITPSPVVTTTSRIRVVIEPASFDIGIGETTDLLVRVSQGEAGVPVTRTVITLSVEPPELALIAGTTTVPALTNENDETATQQLTGRKVGLGKVMARLDTGEAISATLTVRPVVVAPSANINLRSGPSTNAAVVAGTRKGERYVVVGKESDDTWLQVRLADRGLAWVSRKAGVEVEGETTDVPVMSPEVEPIETPSETATPAPVVIIPTPTHGPEGSSTPTSEVSPTLKATGSDPDVPLYRVGRTDEAGILARLPAGGEVEPFQEENAAPPPAGWKLVRVKFWVEVSRVTRQTGSWAFAKADQNGFACWSVPPAGQGGLPCGGILMPNIEGYGAGAEDLPKNGDWRQVTVRVWVKQENIQ